MFNFYSKKPLSATCKTIQNISSKTFLGTKKSSFSKSLAQKVLDNKFAFLKMNQKNFFEFKKQSTPFDQDYSEKKEKVEVWYETNEPLVFTGGKTPIVQATKSDKNLARRLRNYIVFPTMLFSGYKLATSVLVFKFWGCFLWGGLFFLTTRLYRGLTINKYYFVYNINLLEDGRSIEIFGEGAPHIADITDIRRLTPEETVFVLEMMPDARVAYIPIVVKEKFYLVFKNSKIYNAEIFKAICSGKYIKMRESINKDKSIDIGDTK